MASLLRRRVLLAVLAVPVSLLGIQCASLRPKESDVTQVHAWCTIQAVAGRPDTALATLRIKAAREHIQLDTLHGQLVCSRVAIVYP